MCIRFYYFFFFFSSRRRHTRYWRDWSSDVCSSDLGGTAKLTPMIPYRGRYGDARPSPISHLPLPPHSMPSRMGRRPLKAWRYVGVYGPDLMLCVASVRIGPARQAFWAVWDRERLHERTTLGAGRVALSPGRVRVTD